MVTNTRHVPCLPGVLSGCGGGGHSHRNKVLLDNMENLCFSILGREIGAGTIRRAVFVPLSGFSPPLHFCFSPFKIGRATCRFGHCPVGLRELSLG